MKKMITLALMAILLGGIAFNANAQKVVKVNKDNKKTVTIKKDIKAENLEKTLKEFEDAVEHCLTLFNAMKSDDKASKVDLKEYNNSLTKAENLQSTLEKSKGDLDRTQVDRYNKAKKKLLQVYAK